MATVSAKRFSVNDIKSGLAADKAPDEVAQAPQVTQEISPIAAATAGTAGATAQVSMQARRRMLAAAKAAEQVRMPQESVAAPSATPVQNGERKTSLFSSSKSAEQLKTTPLADVVAARVNLQIACNAIKTLAPAVSAAHDKAGAKQILESGEMIASKALEAMGIMDEESIDFNLPRILPDAIHVASEIYMDNPESVMDTDIILNAAHAMAMAGTSKQGSKLAPDAYKSHGASVDLRTSLMSASSAMVSEIVLFRFSKKMKDDIEFASAEVMRMASKSLPMIVPHAATESSVVMVAQSIIRNGFKVMSSCWRRQSVLAVDQAMKIANGSRSAAIEAIQSNTAHWHGIIRDDFRDAMTSVMEITATHVAEESNRRQVEPQAKRKPKLSRLA
jgi:hypothetical protein